MPKEPQSKNGIYFLYVRIGEDVMLENYILTKQNHDDSIEEFNELILKNLEYGELQKKVIQSGKKYWKFCTQYGRDLVKKNKMQNKNFILKVT